MSSITYEIVYEWGQLQPKTRTAGAIEKINLQGRFLPLVDLKWDCYTELRFSIFLCS